MAFAYGVLVEVTDVVIRVYVSWSDFFMETLLVVRLMELLWFTELSDFGPNCV